MDDLKKSIQKKIDSIWPGAQTDISKISRDALKALKKGEKQFTILYAQTKKKTQELVLRAQREELYYELGKTVASLLTSDQLKNKKVLKASTQITQINKKLRSK